MGYKPYHYRWDWELKASPEALWPLVADTNRFDRDSGVPTVSRFQGESSLPNTREHLRYIQYGVALEFEQAPFEWTYPRRFSVTRHFLTGPLGQLRILAELEARPSGGTRLSYQVWATPRNILGLLAIPIQVGVLFARSFTRAFRAYDRMTTSGQLTANTGPKTRLAAGGKARLETHRQSLLGLEYAPGLISRLVETLESGDDLVVSRIRPYELADYWGADRREVLELCLQATRIGLLSFRWDLLCPLCRVAKSTSETLGRLEPHTHCETCHIDYEANFERSVELTFRPNENVRQATNREYCIGGPQATPHVVVQKLLAPGESASFDLQLEQGRYRLRAFELPGGQFLRVTPDGERHAMLQPIPTGWPDAEPALSPSASLAVENPLEEAHLFLFERVAWSDQAVTAAEVIAMQAFRDLFASEALRPGERISVGSLAVVFTDLLGSTRMYRQVGDAPAFGTVMEHFDILKQAINARNGTTVKTIGDAVMAVFRNPADALRAMLGAQIALENTFAGRIPLTLKAGIHYGHCIAVTLNGRLDYFGSTVNLASRLEKFSAGDDIILSDQVFHDPDVQDFLKEQAGTFSSESRSVELRGFEGNFQIWTVKRV